jgi:hypothetical protein
MSARNKGKNERGKDERNKVNKVKMIEIRKGGWKNEKK